MTGHMLITSPVILQVSSVHISLCVLGTFVDKVPEKNIMNTIKFIQSLLLLFTAHMYNNTL